jgi:hypothetical protein
MNFPANRRALLALLLGAVLCTPFGCKSSGVQSSRATTTVPGRRIVAVSDGSVSVQNFGDRAVVLIPSHRVTIERDRVLLDEAELARLPEGAAHIELTATRGQLTITADGAPVATKQLGQ